jgi:class 3 adenylate cyclase
MDVPETRYAATIDGLSIAYQVLGEADLDLLWVPGFASHVELFWELPGYAHTFRRLAGFSRLAVFDKRGTGLSDRALGTGTLEERLQDVEAVADAAGFDELALLGASEGAGLAIMFAAMHPDRVRALITLGGAITGDWVPPQLVEGIEREWGSGALLQRLWLNGAGDLRELGRIERAMGTPRAMAAQMRQNVRTDGSALLPGVRAPTLIMHCVGDPVVPVSSGRELAASIAGARLVEIPGSFHGSNLIEEMDLYVDEVELFLTGGLRHAPLPYDRVLATVLLTDLVGSTKRAGELGDERWSRLLDDHDRTARQAVARFRGRWIKSTGDGSLATFDGPARAIGAAEEIARRLEPLGLTIRAGVHTGEIELRGEDISGLAVHIAARVASLAADGEIWVSATIPGLVVGSGLVFEDVGTHELKGLDAPWRLYRVVTGTPRP